MKWKLVSEEVIREAALSDSAIRFGRRIYREQAFRNIVLTEMHDVIELSAYVDQECQVKIRLNTTEKLQLKCACQKHSDHLACKHSIALLYLYNDIIKDAQKRQGFSKKVGSLTYSVNSRKYVAAKYIMEQMSDFLDAQTGFRGRKKIVFDYQFAFRSLENDDESSVRIKVGEDKLYQMRDIEAVALSFFKRTAYDVW